jgi:hypothetical protein
MFKKIPKEIWFAVIVLGVLILLPRVVQRIEWWSLQSQGQKIQASLPSWEQTEKSHFGTLAFGMLDDELETQAGKVRFLEELQGAVQAGAFFIRPHPSKIFTWGFTEKERGRYDWTITDWVVKTVQDYHAHLLVTIYTWNPWDQPGAVFDAWYLQEPRDWESYDRWLSAMVERYDGDGVSDMPGLRYPLRYFEIGNEIIFDQGNTVFTSLLKHSYSAIKRANPEAVVINGAIKYRNVDVFLAENLIGYIDAFNTHDVNLEDIPSLKAKVGRPVWFSEIIPSSPYEKMNPEKEYSVAKKVFEVYPAVLSMGVEKVFLASSMSSEGILASFHRFLEERIDFFERAETLSVDVVTFYRFVRENRSFTVTSQWPGGLPRYEISFPTEASTVTVTEATTPEHRSWEVQVRDGHAKIDFRLTDDPILIIEEKG